MKVTLNTQGKNKINITKENMLLIYILNTQDSGMSFIPVIYADDIVSLGITKNDNSLRTMLNTLYNKGYLTPVSRIADYCDRWVLTLLGQREAEHWFTKLMTTVNQVEAPSTSCRPSTSQMQEIEKLKAQNANLIATNNKLKDENHMLKDTISGLRQILEGC